MSLDHILLGMLRKPLSGYDLRQEFELGARHYWSAELSQIYPMLKKMQGKGWLESSLQPSAKGPARRVYERTDAGREILFAWLRSGPAIGNERFAYIGQLIFMGELNDLDVTLEFLEQLREEMDAVRQILAAAETGIAVEAKSGELDSVAFHEQLSLRMGVYSLTAKVQWCDESIQAVHTRIQKQKGNPDA